MLVDQTSQSVAEFCRTAVETIDRLNATGEAGFLTVDGQPRAVLLTPAMWKEIQLSRDVAVIRQSIRESAEGKGRDVRDCFDEIHAKLLAMKAVEDEPGLTR